MIHHELQVQRSTKTLTLLSYSKGLPQDLVERTFAIARLMGWTIKEQP